MKNKISIRPARLADCPACEKLGRVKELQIADGKTFLPLWYYKKFIQQQQFFFVAIQKKKVFGFIIGERLTGNGLLLQYMVVSKNSRRHGVGQALIRAIIAHAKSQRIKWCLGYAVKSSPVGILLKRQGAYFGAKVQEFGISLGWK